MAPDRLSAVIVRFDAVNAISDAGRSSSSRDAVRFAAPSLGPYVGPCADPADDRPDDDVSSTMYPYAVLRCVRGPARYSVPYTGTTVPWVNRFCGDAKKRITSATSLT